MRLSSDHIEALSFGAFQNCTSLEEPIIRSGISQIPDQCFYGCTSLKRVVLPDSITAIGERAFMNCPSLNIVEIPVSAFNEKAAIITEKSTFCKTQDVDFIFTLW